MTAWVEETLLNGDRADLHIADRPPGKPSRSLDRARDAADPPANAGPGDELYQHDSKHREHRDQCVGTERRSRREVPEVSDRDPQHQRRARFPHHHGQQGESPPSALYAQQASYQRYGQDEDEQ